MTDTVGFIGLGVLGSAVAQNFVAGGLNVVGYDSSPQASLNASDLGLTMVDSSKQVAQRASIVFTCLPNADALIEAMSGADGITAADMSGQQIVVEMSTLALADKENFANLCVEAGRRPVDCPVSGNRIMALKKALTAFFSGAETDYQLPEPVLALSCSKTHYVGEFGNGSKVKFCGNILNLVHNSVAAEAMVLAMKSGLDPKMFHQVISGSGFQLRDV